MARTKRKAKTRAGERWEFLRFILMLGIIALLLRAFVFASFNIPTASMLPKLMIGDHLFVTKWNYGWSRYSLPFHVPLIERRAFAALPSRGDVVVFKYPGPSKIDYVKRVIGLPGDQIQVRGGVLAINGDAVTRTRIADWPMPVSANSPCRQLAQNVRDEGATCIYPRFRETLPGGKTYDVLDHGDSRFDDTPVFVVPEGHLFMMGDNRDDSLDSRIPVSGRGVGFVPLDHLVGKAGLSFFSTDGSAELIKPWTWFSAARWDRIGMTF